MLKYTVIVEKAATEDIETAFSWYEIQSSRSAERFENEIELFLKRISLYPENYSFHRGTKSIRKIRLKNFPYNIFFFIEEKDVHVIAVIHKSRSEEYIETRLE